MTDPSETEHTGIGLRHYLEVVRRRKWIVIGVVALAGIAAGVASALEKPTYRAETKIVVGQGNSLFQPQVASAVQPFTATMSELVKSNVVAGSVIRNLNLQESPETVLNHVSVSINPLSAALKITVVDHEPGRAKQIAEQIGLVFSDLVKQRFGRFTPASDGAPAIPPLTATIWDPAHIDPGKVSPKPVRNVVIAGALGLVLGLLAAFLRDYFDRSIRAREAVEQSFGVPVIAQIPTLPSRERDEPSVLWDEFGEGPEAFRSLRAGLQYLGVKRPLRSILIASASPEQGKTTVTANLAVAIARSGASTVVIEGDLRRPQLHHSFGVDAREPGLTSVLVGSAELESAVVDVEFPETQIGPGPEGEGWVSFLPSGPLPPNPSELLSSLQMKEVLDRLAASFDYVLIDSPPILPVADALELARLVDGVVLVVRRNRTTTDEARELRAMLERLPIHLVGVVLTDAAPVVSYGPYREPVARENEPTVLEPVAVRQDEF